MPLLGFLDGCIRQQIGVEQEITNGQETLVHVAVLQRRVGREHLRLGLVAGLAAKRPRFEVAGKEPPRPGTTSFAQSIRIVKSFVLLISIGIVEIAERKRAVRSLE
jgi:hypothetical protein